VLISVTACGSGAAGLSSGGRVPAPPLSRLVPSPQRVLAVHQFRLGGGPAPEIAVTTAAAAPAFPGAGAPQDLLLLAWDKYASRWFVAYDAARDPVASVSEPDTAMSSPRSLAAPPRPLLRAGFGVTGLAVRQLRDQDGPGSDLLFWANVQYGDGTGLAAGILHFSGQTATVPWALLTGEPGRVAVAGTAPHQQVAVTTGWQTPVDPHCCPVRGYQFVVGRPARAAPGTGYQVLSDDRPWLGAFVSAPLAAAGAPARATVLRVVPGSPADGLLRPGDVLAGVAGTAAPRGTLLGPAVVDEFAAHREGDRVRLRIQRGGATMTVTVTLGSRASPQAAGVSDEFPPGPHILLL
jgi:PDZ domain-containing protein